MTAMIWRRALLIAELVFFMALVPGAAHRLYETRSARGVIAKWIQAIARQTAVKTTSTQFAATCSAVLPLMALVWGLDWLLGPAVHAREDPTARKSVAYRSVGYITGRYRCSSDGGSGVWSAIRDTILGLLALWTSVSTLVVVTAQFYLLTLTLPFRWTILVAGEVMLAVVTVLGLYDVSLWWRYGHTYGKIIQFHRGKYCHIAIGDGKGFVIHVWRPSTGSVTSDFAVGPIDVRRDPFDAVAGADAWDISLDHHTVPNCKRRSDEATVARALHYLDDTWHYEVMRGNCEHFATHCAFDHPDGACGGFSLQANHGIKVVVGVATVLGAVAAMAAKDPSWVGYITGGVKKLLDALNSVPSAFMSWLKYQSPNKHRVQRRECKHSRKQ